MFDNNKLDRKEKLKNVVILNHLISICLGIIRKTGYLNKKTVDKLAHMWAELSATILFDWVDNILPSEYMDAKSKFDEQFGDSDNFNTGNFNDLVD